MQFMRGDHDEEGRPKLIFVNLISKKFQKFHDNKQARYKQEIDRFTFAVEILLGLENIEGVIHP